MAANNRHLRGDTKEIEVPVHGHTTLEKGDMVIIMNSDNSLSSSYAPETTADYYCYPASYLAGVTTYYFANQFAGIAMQGSASGSTDTVRVATAGVFRMPLKATTGVTVGQLVAGATSGAKAMYAQKVVSKKASEIEDEYLTAIGVCVKTEAGAENVDFELITRFSGTTYNTLNTIGL